MDDGKARWLEISVAAGTEAAEAVVELFNRYGRGRAVVETPIDCFEYELEDGCLPSEVIVKTYLPLDGSTRQARRRLEEGLWHLGQILPLPSPVFRELAESDWSVAWKKSYHRLHVGRRIVLVPAWETYEPAPDQVVVHLEPGQAFGTGLHPTTRLCLEALEDLVRPGCTLLDVGTGSGVLAIAAARLGAGPVLALDADPVAVRTAAENVAANGVARQVTVCHASLPGGDALPRHFSLDGSVELLDGGRYDLVLINILAPVIVGMAPALAARTRPSGYLVAAGLIEDQEEAVASALQAHGFTIVRRTRENDWICLVARRD